MLLHSQKIREKEGKVKRLKKVKSLIMFPLTGGSGSNGSLWDSSRKYDGSENGDSPLKKLLVLFHR